MEHATISPVVKMSRDFYDTIEDVWKELKERAEEVASRKDQHTDKMIQRTIELLMYGNPDHLATFFSPSSSDLTTTQRDKLIEDLINTVSNVVAEEDIKNEENESINTESKALDALESAFTKIEDIISESENKQPHTSESSILHELKKKHATDIKAVEDTAERNHKHTVLALEDKCNAAERLQDKCNALVSNQDLKIEAGIQDGIARFKQENTDEIKNRIEAGIKDSIDRMKQEHTEEIKNRIEAGIKDSIDRMKQKNIDEMKKCEDEYSQKEKDIEQKLNDAIHEATAAKAKVIETEKAMALLKKKSSGNGRPGNSGGNSSKDSDAIEGPGGIAFILRLNSLSVSVLGDVEANKLVTATTLYMQSSEQPCESKLLAGMLVTMVEDVRRLLIDSFLKYSAESDVHKILALHLHRELTDTDSNHLTKFLEANQDEMMSLSKDSIARQIITECKINNPVSVLKYYKLCRMSGCAKMLQLLRMDLQNNVFIFPNEELEYSTDEQARYPTSAFDHFISIAKLPDAKEKFIDLL